MTTANDYFAPVELTAEDYTALSGFPVYHFAVAPRVIPVANPAAGTDWSIPVPGGVTWFLQSLFATLATSAVVANRVPVMRFLSQGTRFADHLLTNANLVASNTNRITLDRGIAAWSANIGGVQTGPAFGFPLFAGLTLQVATVSIDVGDQWSAIGLYVLEVRTRDPIEMQLYLNALLSGQPDAVPGVIDYT